MGWRFYFKGIGLCIIIALFFSLVSLTHLIEPLELKAIDLRFRLRGPIPPSERIRIILVDDYTMRKVNRHPFPRDLFALLVHVLGKDEYRPIQIGFDILFAEPSDPTHDALLAEITGLFSNVYHIICFHESKGWKADDSLKEILCRSSYNMNFDEFMEANGLTTSIPSILERAKGVGHVNVVPDRDGVVRRVPLLIEYEERLYPNLALKMATDYLGADKIRIEEGHLIIEGKGRTIRRIPIDRKGRMMIDFAGGKGLIEFKNHSFIQVLQSDEQIREGKRPFVSLFEYKDKIVLLGVVATGLYDLCPTPFSSSYPGIGIFANILDNIIEDRFLRKAGAITNGGFVILFGLIMGLFLQRRGPKRQLFYTLLVLLFCTVVNFLFFKYLRVLIDIVPALFCIISCYPPLALRQYLYEEKRLELKIDGLIREKESILRERIRLEERLKEVLARGDEGLKRKAEEMRTEIRTLKLLMDEKEKMINKLLSARLKVEEPERGLSLEIDFETHKIAFINEDGSIIKRETFRLNQPLRLLEEITRKGKIHWLDGFYLFDGWDSKRPENPRGSFTLVVNRLNEIFRKDFGNIIKPTEYGTYELTISHDRYRSNISRASEMVKEVKGLLEKGKPDEAVKIAREALRVDPVNREIYDLLKSIREGFGNKELEDLRKRLVTQISRYQKALEAIDSRKEELGDIEKEIEVIKGELYQLEGRLDEFGIKEGEEDPRLSRILDLIRKAKEADETPYEDSSFKELLKSDFFPDLLRYAVSKVRIGEDHDVMRNSLSILYEIIKEEFDPMRCKDYSGVKSYFYKALPNRLLDKTLYEEYGISPSDCARLRRKWKAESELEQELGRPPKDSEVCERLKCKDDWLNDVKSIEAILSRDFSVDELKDII